MWRQIKKKCSWREQGSPLWSRWILAVEYKSNGFDLRPVGLLKEAITRDVRVFASFLCFRVRISRSNGGKERNFPSVSSPSGFFPFTYRQTRTTSDPYHIFRSEVCHSDEFYCFIFLNLFFFFLIAVLFCRTAIARFIATSFASKTIMAANFNLRIQYSQNRLSSAVLLCLRVSPTI